MTSKETLQEELRSLIAEHRALDQAISAMVAAPPFDQINLQRLKKRKLAIRDRIETLENLLIPDIIA